MAVTTAFDTFIEFIIKWYINNASECCVLSVYGLVWLCNVYGVMMLQYCWLPSTYTGRTSGALQTEQIFEQTTHLAQLQCSNKWTSNTMHRRLSRDPIIGEKMDDRTLSITLNCLQCSDFIINDRSDQFSLFMRVSVRVCVCVVCRLARIKKEAA